MRSTREMRGRRRMWWSQQLSPPHAVPEHVPALPRDLGEGAGVTGAGTEGAEGVLLPEGFCAW